MPEKERRIVVWCPANERRTRRATVELALERYLQAAGFWPPPSSSTPPTSS